MASPVYANNSGNPVFAGSNSVVVSVPSGVATGDLMIAEIWESDQNAAAPTNAAWTQFFTLQGSDHQIYLFWRDVSSEPGSYTFTSSNAGSMTGWIHHITGAVSGNPVNAIGAGNTTAGAASITASAITTTVANTLNLCFVGHGDGSNIPSAYQSGWTGVTFTGNSPINCSYITQASAGSSGSATTTFPGNDDYTAVIVAIAPNTAVPVVYTPYTQTQFFVNDRPVQF